MSELLKTSHHTTKNLSRLLDTVTELDRAVGKDEIVKTFSALAVESLRFQYLFLARVNFKRTHYTISVVSPEGSAPEIDHKHFDIRSGMPGWVINHRSPITVDIASAPNTDAAFEDYLQTLGIASLMIVPLQTGDIIDGAAVFGHPEPGYFNESDLSVASFLGTHLAIALRNTRLHEERGKRLAQLELINKLAHRITSTLDVNELLSSAAEAIQKNFNYFDVTIFLREPATEYLTLVAHSGNYIDFLPHGYRQKVGTGIVGWTAANRQSVLLNDVSVDERYMTYAYHNTNSELTVPITYDNDVLGVINVEDSRLNAFDDMDRIVLETLADQLGSALRNARLYDDIKRSNEKLIELDKMKSEFLSIVSHDFRSPLSSIILAAKALIRNNDVQDNRRVVEYLKIIEDQAVRLNHMAEEMLSITRLEAGRLTYNFKVVNVQRLIHDAIALVRFSHRHSLDLSIDEHISFIKADESKVRQVVHNIVANAVKYSPQGGTVTVAVKDYYDDRILVSVRDDGIGIPESERGLIFKKFGRVQNDDTKNIKGSGLGLWISREIIHAHGGEIWFDTIPGKQTTFLFTLKKAH
jgi:K+-sensing histidine kinase KdpD